jgi:malonyl CoA-acyl carrier protein transacylase
MSRSAVVLCPGRGSYTGGELGYLSRPAPLEPLQPLWAALDAVDARRAACGDRPLRELDGAGSFTAEMLRGENASGLTFAATAFDFLRLDRDAVEVVAVGGNSMGWYSALFAAGALGLDDTFELVETMGGATRDGTIGGQIVYPIVNEQWHVDDERRARVEAALEVVRADGLQAGWSIRYGGFAVLWAEQDGIDKLRGALPELEIGARTYPLALPGHSAFHSALMEPVSGRALRQLAALGWHAPDASLIDGRGHVWRPRWIDPEALMRYTLQTQVLETFDFSATVRVALREYAPELVVLLGPGDALGAAVAQVVIAERWQGIDSRDAFAHRQQDDPLLISLARPEQAEAVTLPAAGATITP